MFGQKLFLISKFGHGFTLWILLLLSIASLSILIYKYMILKEWIKATTIAKKFIQKAVESCEISSIQSLHLSFTNNEKDPGTRLIASYIKSKKYNMIVDIFDSFMTSKKSQLESWLGVLASIGSNAPFIGLLGTIFGVMDSFYAMGDAGGSNASVMLGISNALLATAVGLITAIPAIMGYNYSRRKITIVMQNLDYIKGGYLLLQKDQQNKNGQSV